MGLFDDCIKKAGNKYEFVDNQELRQEMNLLVETINRNSNLPMPLLIVCDNAIIPQANKSIPNFMSYDFYYDDYTLIFSGYPTDENHNFLTDMEICGRKYNFLGVSVNDNKNETIKKLTDFGFEQTKDKKTSFRNYSRNADVLCFKKLDVKAAIIFSDEKVSKIVISIVSYYLGNRLY